MVARSVEAGVPANSRKWKGVAAWQDESVAASTEAIASSAWRSSRSMSLAGEGEPAAPAV